MVGLFLQDLALTNTQEISQDSAGVYFVILTFLVFIIFVIYVYLSIVYQKIGKKTGLKSPGVAWMPFLGPIAIIFESSKMHWWPFLLVIIGYHIGYPIILSGWLVGNAMLNFAWFVLLVCFGVFSVMAIIWHWKTYEAVGKPGWWILDSVIPFFMGYMLLSLGIYYKTYEWIIYTGAISMVLGIIVHLVSLGIAAFGKDKKETKKDTSIKK